MSNCRHCTIQSFSSLTFFTKLFISIFTKEITRFAHSGQSGTAAFFFFFFCSSTHRAVDRAYSTLASIMADWSKLPYDIIHKVATHLSDTEDFLAFSAVCCSWRLVYLYKQWSPGPQLPVLLFSNDEINVIGSLLSMYKNKVSNLEVPGAYGKRCWCSSSGWLVTIGGDLQLQLLNPFTRVSLNLPARSSLRVSFGDFLSWCDIIERAYVFRNPSTSNANEDLLVMIIYGTLKQLAFCRPGYTSWKRIKDRKRSHAEFIDLTCVKDQIFALSYTGSLVHVDIDTLGVTSVSGQDPPRNVALSLLIGGSERISLVESSGDLWMVYQNRECHRWTSRVEATSFLVYRFDFDKKQWIRLSDLGSHTIFVGGDNSCIAVSSAHYSKCQSNSIYFVASKKEKDWPKRVIHVDLGVYSLSSGESVPLCITHDVRKQFCYPIWVIPSLH